MKKQNKSVFTSILIVIINVIFVFGLFAAEFQYISSTRKQNVTKNEESFVNTNASLVSMTENYLVGESHLCRSWSNYLNSNVQTMDDAIEFVRKSISDTDVMGHIVYKTDLTGYSTKASSINENNYAVSYSSISNEDFPEAKEGVRLSPSYINPINGSPSIAFYNDIKLIDPNDASKQVDAYLFRVVLIDNFRQRWTFPSGSFKNLQVTITDKKGNYIISGKSFKNSNFFEFYKSYNKTTDESVATLKDKVINNNGLMKMNNATGEECYVAYSHFTSSVDWILFTYTPAKDITTVTIDWLLISILGAGLFALFIIDLAILLRLNKNLTETAKIAESANKAKTDFLSTMSHDIRTPMNAIVGLTTLAKDEPNNPPSTQDSLKKIELASNHLLTLINDILDLSKIESGRLSINPLDFSIVDLFENLVNISQPTIKSKNIDFSFIVHHLDHEWLYADKLRLSQIFTNLLSNALKYTLENGKVTVEAEEKPSEKEGCVQLIYKIQDTGIGMSQEFIDKMYEPFARATDSRVNSIQGTGLGLAIIKKMVDLMEGNITCESELDKGTTFVVTLDIPISQKPTEEVVVSELDILGTEKKESKEETFTNIRVLVTEDNDINWEIISALLEKYGVVSDHAQNGKAALELLENPNNDNKWDLVFMDIQMPVMNGLDATRAIRKIDREYTKNVPIIAMTADAFSENITECLEAGMNGHIAKPVDINLVLNELRKISAKKNK